MPAYRRNYEGRCFFFMIVTADRQPLFRNRSAIAALGEIVRRTATERPVLTQAAVLLPDHLHLVWRMEESDTDYSTRIAVIKKRFTHWYLGQGLPESRVPPGQRRHRLRGVWQVRFWEHTIRDGRDWQMHVDYIHANPVKHGLTVRPWDWPWSTFRRYVRRGHYEPDWCGHVELPGDVEYLYVE